MWYRLKLRGGALYIALIISLVTGIILSVFILIAYFNQRQVIGRLATTQLQFNLKSGLAMAGSQVFSEAQNNRWQALPTDDSLRVKKLQWGSYALICVESKNLHQYVRSAGIYGFLAGTDTALVVGDHGRPVGLSGRIVFNGNCYLPKAGIKPAYIEGESFNADPDINNFIKQGPAQVPAVEPKFTEALKKSINNLDAATDSLISSLQNTMAVNFACKTAVLQAGDLALGSYTLAGNIKLIGNEVQVEKECVLDNILIVAKKVRIKSGFKGSLHVIASDSIIVEEQSILNYPSSLTIMNDGSGPPTRGAIKGIFLGDSCQVHGALVALGESIDNKVMVKLNRACEVYGLVYSNNYAHVQGKIYGSVFCETLLLSTPSAVYENHILSCELDPKKYGGSLVVPGIFKSNLSYACCKWL